MENLRIRILVIMRKEGGYLFANEIIIVRNRKKDGAKVTKEDLKFMDPLQKVMKYWRTFEESDVTFSAAKIRYIVEDMKY